MAAGSTHSHGRVGCGSIGRDDVACHKGSSKRPIHSFRTLFSPRGGNCGGLGIGIMALVFSWLVIKGKQSPQSGHVSMESVQNDNRRNVGWAKRSFLCDGGFTLIELLIVLGITSIVLMLAQSWLVSQLPHWRLNGAARQVTSDLLGAKMKAVMERNRQRVFFQDDHRYFVLDDDNDNGKSDPGEHLEARDIQLSYRDVMIAASNNPSFLPRGTASSLASITLSNSAGKRIITVSITGRVKVRS